MNRRLFSALKSIFTLTTAAGMIYEHSHEKTYFIWILKNQPMFLSSLVSIFLFVA